MLYNGITDGIKETAKQPTVWAILASVNPVALGIGAVGLVAFALYNGAKSGKKPKKQPLPDGSRTVAATVPSTADSTVDNGVADGTDTVESMSEEELQKEIIRQAMSELGKRSAAARARKKKNS
ncbi:MAG: hypothetical protein GC185_13490 [Alphaproteobacteria bacterium]|nr:hypothetical protein [Alphaproteobacteria bacterium]